MVRHICSIAVLITVSVISRNVHAQPASDTLMVPMTGQERSVVLSMCQSATWANRQAFDGVCEFFKVKFETVERAKAAEAKPAEAKPESSDKPKE